MENSRAKGIIKADASTSRLGNKYAFGTTILYMPFFSTVYLGASNTYLAMSLFWVGNLHMNAGLEQEHATIFGEQIVTICAGQATSGAINMHVCPKERRERRPPRLPTGMWRTVLESKSHQF